MARYSVLPSQQDQRFYVVDLDAPTEHDGRTFYKIVGSIFGHAEVNQAWRELMRLTDMERSEAR